MLASRLIPGSTWVLCIGAVLFGLRGLDANGLNRNGIGAKAMSLGGAANADVLDTFAATSANPALLGFTMSDDFSLGLVGGIVDGSFENGGSVRGLIDDRAGAFPELAVRRILRPGMALGLSLVPEQARIADWIYEDRPGGADGNTSYGVRAHHSEILALRGAVSLGIQISDTLAVGAGIGVTYNRNGLVAPYSFQSHPALAGFKTLLDLETEGYGLNGDLGVVWKPEECLTLALTYRTPTTIQTDGEASGDLRAQFDSLGLATVPSTFHYDAEVENEFPDILTAGISWQASAKTRFAFQVDWVGWEDSFNELTVRLDRGSNSAINGLLSDDGIVDTIPLDWEDCLVFHLGVEHEFATDWFLRFGYTHGRAPVPDHTLLPMTAAISEDSLSAGIGHVCGPWRIDLAYQIDLPASRDIGTTAIRSGEYAGSRIDLTSHWIALTVGYEF